MVVDCLTVCRGSGTISRMRIRGLWLILFAVLAFPYEGECCEPVLPLAQLLAGGTLAGPLFISRSLLLLGAAVAIKSATFVFFERRLSPTRAVKYMVLANVLSTIPGVIIAAFTASNTPLVLAGFIVVSVLGHLVGRRLELLGKTANKPPISGLGAAVGFMLFFYLSMVLYYIAGKALDSGSYVEYWFFKFFFVTMVAGTGILISTVLEEGVIANLARGVHGNISFYKSVWRSNYVTLCFILLVAALQTLPRRIASPHFLASWLQSLLAILGWS